MAKFSSLIRSGADGWMDGWMGRNMDGIHQRLISRKKKYG
jgi:hypothetical protein